MRNAEKAQRKLVAAWTHPVGTPVVVTKDLGEQAKTRTRSGAWMLGDNSQGVGGHTAVIMLEGISGCYALDRVRLDESAAAAVTGSAS